jgi:Zn-dependent peptidase ImmA (M78 family)/DNA-binding XRE family transcriptional regulator
MEAQMRRKDLAHITPALLTWGINRSGLDRAEIAKALHIQPNILEAWEKGYSSPQINKALELAKVLHLPFGYFYLRQPPAIEIPLPDFRTLKDAQYRKPSINFLDALFQAMAQQDWYKTYLQEQGAQQLPFLGRFTVKDNPETVAQDIIETLGLNNTLRRNAGNWSNYLTKLSQRAEEVGIIVMRRAVVGSSNRRKLSRDEFQGFTISDPIAPLIVINGQDFEAAKIFSLLHELAHVWIGESGISNAEQNLNKPQTFAIETFCNSVAANALVPRPEFLKVWREHPDYEQIGKLARYFLVSTLVILRRAREFSLLGYQDFNVLLEEAREQVTEKTQPTSPGGNFYNTLDSRNSPKFVDTLVLDVQREGTLYRDAARLLRVRVPTIEKMVEGIKSP